VFVHARAPFYSIRHTTPAAFFVSFYSLAPLCGRFLFVSDVYRLHTPLSAHPHPPVFLHVFAANSPRRRVPLLAREYLSVIFPLPCVCPVGALNLLDKNKHRRFERCCMNCETVLTK
jgi:hypothetical protein